MMKTSNLVKNGKKALVILLCLLLSFAIVSINWVTERSRVLAAAELTKYTTDYDSLEDVRTAMADLNEQIGEEGFVLLKNDNNTLPLSKGAKISLFGKNSVNPVLKGSGSSGSVGDGAVDIVASLKAAQFDVNPNLTKFYEDVNASGPVRPETGFSSYNYNSYFPTAETPQSKYTQAVKDSYANYADAAVVVFSRTGGEGTDLPTSSFVKQADAGKVPTSANARAYPTIEEVESGTWVPYGGEGRENTPFAHYLELDENEIDLIDEVTAAFSKVIVVLNSNNAMELSREKLINNDKVQSIIFAPGGGQNGFAALGKILNGDVNPSGRLADTFAADFTADPTYSNFSNNNVGYFGEGIAGNTYLTEEGLAYESNFGEKVYSVEYEEGIYVGYKYYETRGYAENDNDVWYKSAVNYPFGYGLSYTTFTMSLESITPADGGKITASSEITATVKVTNTGSVAGKQVVQMYYSAPYVDQKTEKSHVTLAAFAKTGTIAPGGEETVTLKFNAFDMASFDVYDKDVDGHKGYELDAGDYILYIGANAHSWADANVLSATLNVESEINIDIDPISGNDVSVLFDDSNTEMQGKTMSRYDFAGTFPTRPLWFDVENDTTLDPMWVAEMKAADSNFNPDTYTGTKVYLKRGKAALVKTQAWLNNFDQKLIEGATIGNAVIDPSFDAGQPWYSATAPAFRSEAEAYSAENPAPTQLIDMVGVAADDESWDAFVNQLTIDQAYSLIEATMFQFNAMDAVGAPAAGHSDGPLGLSGSWVGGGDSIIAPMGGGSSAIKFTMATEALVACTWNVELARKEGELVGDMGLWTRTIGWYAPAANIHRSPFAGRNFEYYSEDGVLSAYMLTAITEGARSKGMVTFLKHFALNDQETNRDTNGIATWADEQTMREIYYLPFRWAVEKADANGAMSSFNRIGFDWAGGSYELLTELLRNEWGFKGAVITDAHGSGYGCMNGNLMIRMGNDMSLDSRADSIARMVNSDVSNSPTQLTAVHNSVKHIMYTVLNSAAMRNGYTGTIAYNAGNAYSSFAYTAGTAGNLGAYLPNESVNVTVSDGDTEHFYMRVMGALPNGLTLDKATGKITGTVAADAESKTYTFTVGKTEKTIATGEQCYVGVSGKMASQQLRVFSITVGKLLPVDSGAIVTSAGARFSLDASVIGGKNTTYAFKANSNVPNGVKIDANSGLVYGTVAASGTYTLTVVATDGGDTLEVPVTIYAASLAFEGGALTEGYQGFAYAGSVANAKLTNAPDGTAVAVTYSLAKDAVLPEGLSLSANGFISGVTNVEVGTYTFAVTASAGVYGSVTSTYTIEIKSSQAIKGEDGANGADGAPGTPGTNGTNGKDGKDASALTGILGTVFGAIGLVVGGAAIALVLLKKKKD